MTNDNHDDLFSGLIQKKNHQRITKQQQEEATVSKPLHKNNTNNNNNNNTSSRLCCLRSAIPIVGMICFVIGIYVENRMDGSSLFRNDIIGSSTRISNYANKSQNSINTSNATTIISVTGGNNYVYDGNNDFGLVSSSSISNGGDGENSENEQRAIDMDIKTQNFRNGTAFMLSIHITHHAGTFICDMMKNTLNIPTPPFACMGDKDNWPSKIPKSFEKHWNNYRDTTKMVNLVPRYYKFISWEFGSWNNKANGWGNLHHVNWEDDNLLSLIVMRHPIERFLSGGKCDKYHYIKEVNDYDPSENIDNTTIQSIWWEYANERCSDNYALKVLAQDGNCCDGSLTSPQYLMGAKSLLRRFTFVVDQSCIVESTQMISNKLGFNTTIIDKKAKNHQHNPNIRERIGNDALYEYLLDRFHLDIELYEWSKSISVVKC